jgi:serine/threonine-protein kinase
MGGVRDWRLWGALAAALAIVVLALVLLTGDDETAVPSVVGLEEEAASDAIVASEFSTQIERRPSPEPRGTVIGQDPGPGTALESGEVVTLTVSGEPGADDVAVEDAGPVEVPNVVGRQYVLAGASLERLGLVPDSRVVEQGDRWGAILAQRPADGKTLEAGDHIELEVALATDTERLDIPVPDLVGEPAAQARALARELGFTMRTIERESPSADVAGTVLEQQPREGATVPELSLIRLVVGE